MQRQGDGARKVVGHAHVLGGERAAALVQDQVARLGDAVAGVAHRAGVHQEAALVR